MQFEKKQVSRLQRLEIHLAPWSPKIHFVGLLLGEKLEPLVVGDSNEKLHGGAGRQRQSRTSAAATPDFVWRLLRQRRRRLLIRMTC